MRRSRVRRGAPAGCAALRPPIVRTVVVNVAFGLVALFFATMAWTGHTEFGQLRELPLAPEHHVYALWGLAATAAVVPVLSLKQLPAIWNGRQLEIAGDVIDLPHGLGLAKRTRVSAREVTKVVLADLGGGPVIHVAWANGDSYLPKHWFEDEATFARALQALAAFAERP